MKIIYDDKFDVFRAEIRNEARDVAEHMTDEAIKKEVERCRIQFFAVNRFCEDVVFGAWKKAGLIEDPPNELQRLFFDEMQKFLARLDECESEFNGVLIRRGFESEGYFEKHPKGVWDEKDCAKGTAFGYRNSKCFGAVEDVGE